MRTLSILLVAVAVAAPTALGQGTGGQFAEPMTWPECREVLESLSASPDQIQVATGLHDTYLERMTTIRQEDIDPFLDDHGSFSFLDGSSVDEVRTAQASAKAIRRDLAEIDEILFNDLAALMGPSQQAGLSRALDRRTRDAIRMRRGQFGTLLSFSERIELADLFDRGEMTAEQLASLDSSIVPWEYALTDHLEAWDAAADRALLEMAQAFAQREEISLPEDFDPADQEALKAHMHETMAVVQEAQNRSRAMMRPIRERLRRHLHDGLEQLAVLLGPESGLMAVRRGVPMGTGADATRSTADDVRPRLDETGQARLDAVITDWQTDATAMLLENLEALWAWNDEQRAAMYRMTTSEDHALDFPEHPAMAMGQAWRTRHDRAISDILALDPDAESLTASASIPTLHADGHSPTSSGVSTSVVMISAGDGEVMSEGGGSIVMSASFSGDAMGMGMSHGGPPPLDDTMMRRLARELALDDEGHAQLEAARQGHVAALQALTRNDASLADLMQQAASGEEIDQTAIVSLIMTPKDPERTAAFDNDFFDAVRTLASDPAKVEPYRLQRARHRLNTSGGLMNLSVDVMGVSDVRWKADLFEAVHDPDLSQSDRQLALEHLESWHARATDRQRKINDATRTWEEVMHAQMQHQFGDGSASIDVEIDHEEMSQLQERISSLRTNAAQANQVVADAIIAALADPVPFRRAWLKQAYPRVATDDPFLDRYVDALELDDLNFDQRASIATLRAEHIDRWWATTENMITEQHDVETPQLVDSADAWEAHERVMQRVDRMRFERREAALKGLETLRGVLNEEQLADAGGLEDPSEHRGFQWSF